MNEAVLNGEGARGGGAAGEGVASRATFGGPGAPETRGSSRVDALALTAGLDANLPAKPGCKAVGVKR